MDEIVRPDTDEPYGHFNTKNEALAIATQVSREQESHLVIHHERGRIEDKVLRNSYPYQPGVKAE